MFGLKTGKNEEIRETSTALATRVEEFLLQVLAEQTAEEVMELTKPMFEKYVLETYGMVPKVIEVVTVDNTKRITGVVHEKFETVLQLVNLEIPVFLTGAAGTGKNVICQQTAEALGLDFYFTNAVTQEFQLKGFTDAHGVYHQTQFFEAFTKGGLFFLDEIDASVPEALIILNSAIANGYFDFPAPIGRKEAHESFRVVSAGNTTGTGADIEYTGRFQLDASSLDRFSLVEIDYSPSIEQYITDGNLELCEFARTFRKITTYSSIRCLFSYRSMERIHKMEQFFDSLPEVLKMALVKGLGVDDLQFICNKFDEYDVDNKYVKALNELCEEQGKDVMNHSY